jgi:hypothetical protein
LVFLLQEFKKNYLAFKYVGFERHLMKDIPEARRAH